MNTDKHGCLTNYAAALHLRVLKIQEECKFQAGSLQVAQALRHMRGGELVDALQFDDQLIFNNQIGDIFADDFAFVLYRVGNLGVDGDAAQGQFRHQGSLIQFLKETSA